MEISHRKPVVVLVVLVLLIAGYFIWRTFRAPDTKFNQPLFVGSGQVVAEETVKAVNDRGRVVAVIGADQLQEDAPQHTQWQTFRKELQKHSAITLAATETIAYDPADPQSDMTACPISSFQSILGKHKDVDAIVFFVGLPAWHWVEEKNALPPGVTAKVIILANLSGSTKPHYEEYLKKGVISSLIIRCGGTRPVPNPKSAREWFDSEYQIFTPQNYESLPVEPVIGRDL